MWMVLALVGVIILLIWCLSSPFYWRHKKIPYLIPLPLFGNYYPVITQGVRKVQETLYNKFPGEKFYGIHFFTKPTLLVKDPELIQRILVSDFEYFTSHGIYLNQDSDPACGNLFNTYGQQWKTLRGKLSAYFTPAKVKAMLTNADTTLPKAMKLIDDNIAKGEPTDVQLLMINIATDILTQSVFGIETDVFENKNSIFTEIAVEAFNKPRVTFKLFMGIIYPKILRVLNLCILDEKYNNYIADIVSRTIAYRRKENVQMQDFLQGMMELMDSDTSTEQKYFPDKTRVPRFDFQTVNSQATLFLIAGTETTAITSTYLLYELAMHPEIQDKCRKEIESVMKETGSEITVADTNKLSYVTAAIQETMRLHTPGSLINRECTKRYVIPGSEVIIDPGTYILLSQVGINMDPKYYPEPQVFRPERFLYGNKIHAASYFPFGLGPRSCLGMGFAYAEMKLTVANLLSRYEVSVCPKTDVTPKKFSILNTFANGMLLNVRPIKKL